MQLQQKSKIFTHLGGLERPTLWLTAKRANPLCHKCLTLETVDETTFLIELQCSSKLY